MLSNVLLNLIVYCNIIFAYNFTDIITPLTTILDAITTEELATNPFKEPSNISVDYDFIDDTRTADNTSSRRVSNYEYYYSYDDKATSAGSNDTISNNKHKHRNRNKAENDKSAQRHPEIIVKTEEEMLRAAISHMEDIEKRFKGSGSKGNDDDSERKVSRKGYQVWKAKFKTAAYSEQFAGEFKFMDVWRWADNEVEFLLAPKDINHFRDMFRSFNVTYEILVPDLQNQIDADNRMNEHSRRSGAGFGFDLNFDFDFFNGEDIIPHENYLRDVNLKRLTTKTTPKPTTTFRFFPNWTHPFYPSLYEIEWFIWAIVWRDPKHFKMKYQQITTQHRRLMILEFFPKGEPALPPVLIEGGCYGREWTSITTVLYIIHKMSYDFKNLPDYVTDNDWTFIPILNPDGYNYALKKDRMWRKNRHRFSGPCDGVDLNRNFELSWGGPGGSLDPCSPFFSGMVPFSEGETVLLRELLAVTPFVGYVSVHTYGSMIYYPWATTGKSTPDNKRHTFIANGMIKAMRKVDGKQFKHAFFSPTKRAMSGTSMDWIYSKEIVDSYFLETRGASDGRFHLHSHAILLAGMETYAAIEYLASEL